MAQLQMSVEDLNAGVNSGAPPAFDQALVGKRVEVLWPYTDKNTGKRVLIWATGRVARVADGLTHKSSARARTVLPAGMVLWTWEADPEYEEPAGEKWLALQPKKWNKQPNSTAGATIRVSSLLPPLLRATKGGVTRAWTARRDLPTRDERRREHAHG